MNRKKRLTICIQIVYAIGFLFWLVALNGGDVDSIPYQLAGEVPEPANSAIIALGGWLLHRRRKHRSRS